ncbi:MAG: hypothetical protein K2G76_05780 [Prevotella sp.]|nr:hypothetical protein [Prevotella sp.]
MGVALSPDLPRTVCRPAPHHARTHSAPCAEAVRIMRRPAPHYARIRSASCPDALGTMCRSAPHCVLGITAYFASLILFSSKKRYDRN